MAECSLLAARCPAADRLTGYTLAVTIALKLTHAEPRLVSLALVYHLARPGSELDPATKQPSPHGLRDVAAALERQLDADGAIIELDPEQYARLLSAIFGCVNELRVHHMRAGAPGDVPGFTEAARRLFPALAADSSAALDLAQSMMMLHRRIERAVSRASEAASDVHRETRQRGGRWPFRRR